LFYKGDGAVSILPIDMSITVQRTVEINRMPTGEAAARPEMSQDEFAKRLSEEARQQGQQVNTTNKTEENFINRDGRGSGGYAAGKRKKGNEKKGSGTKPNKTSSNGSLFDVSI
jgi:hypothetical protein